MKLEEASIEQKRSSWNKKERKIIKCACGCGNERINVSKAGVDRKYIKGHNKPWLGKKRVFSQEHRRKLSETNNHVPPPKYGEENNSWKGDEASYYAKHIWVSLNKGRPQKCEHCLRDDQKKYEWANIDHKYRRKVEDYIRLCVKCHREYDKVNN